MSDRARDLYVVYMGGTATAVQCWDDGVVDTDLKRRWEAVSVAVERERQEAIADVIARREGTRA